MIFNTEVYRESGLNDSAFVTLLIVKSKDYKELSMRTFMCQQLIEREWLTTLKTTRKEQPEWERYRLTKKAKNFLRDLEIPGINDEVKELGAALFELYDGTDRIGNKKSCIRKLAWFLEETEADSSTIIEAVSDYLHTQDPQYIIKLDNLIHRPPNAFSTKFQLENSKLNDLINKK